MGPTQPTARTTSCRWIAALWQTKGAGVGLANLRTRLQILHGEASELRDA